MKNKKTLIIVLVIICLLCVISSIVAYVVARNSVNPVVGIPVGTEVSIEGKVICLPHKDTSGPTTLECAFGLKGDDGKNYGLKDISGQYMFDFDTEQRIRVKGKIVENTSTVYDIVNTIEIGSIEKL